MSKSFGAIAAFVAASALACGAATAGEPIINTVAGGGVYDVNVGDGGFAKQAFVGAPTDVAVDADGNLYIAAACRIRKVTPGGTISTFAGTGSGGTGPVTGDKANTKANCTRTVAVDGLGYVWYFSNGQVGKISPTGIVTIVGGKPGATTGYEGDGGPAMGAKFYVLRDIAVDAAGNAFLADGNRVRKIDTNGIITTFAGNGVPPVPGVANGDYGLATSASLDPDDIALDRDGNLYISDRLVSSIRKVDRKTGLITRIWGGFPQFRSDPMAIRTSAGLPAGLAVDASNNVMVSDQNGFVSMISSDNAIDHVVGPFNDTTFSDGGNGRGFEGDGGPARLAKMHEPDGIAVDAQGNLYIADTLNDRVRKVTGGFPRPKRPAGAFAFKNATDPTFVSANQETIGLAAGDANGDLRDDIYVLTGNWLPEEVHPGDFGLFLYLQDARGKLAAPVGIELPHVQWTDIMAVDLNHDQYIDLALSAYDYNEVTDGLFVMLGSAKGLSAPVRVGGVNGVDRASFLAQADMNHDGHMDVLTYLSTGGSGVGTYTGWGIFYGDGKGGFSRRKWSRQKGGSLHVLQDFNKDGWPDMVYSDTYGELRVAYHDKVDDFLPSIAYLGTETGTRVTAGDFDSDGVKDVIFSFDGNAPYSKLVQWRQTPDGGFEYVGEWGTFDGPQTLIGADINGDKRDDLLVRHTGWSSIGYMQQARRSDGTWGLDRETKAYIRVYNQSQPHGMVLGDFNDDQCTDIAATGSNSGLQIQYATTCIRVKQGHDAPRPPAGFTPSASVAPGSTPAPQSSASQHAAPTTEATKLHEAVARVVRATQAAVYARPAAAAMFAVGSLSFLFVGVWAFASGRWWWRRG